MRVSAVEAGCWVGGHVGWRGIGEVVLIAQRYGFVVSDDDVWALDRFMAGEEVTVTVVDMSDDAERWLNEHVAPKGFSFGWHDGEFFLWSDADWAADC